MSINNATKTTMHWQGDKNSNVRVNVTKNKALTRILQCSCRVNQQCHKKTHWQGDKNTSVCVMSINNVTKKQQSIDNKTPMFVSSHKIQGIDKETPMFVSCQSTMSHKNNNALTTGHQCLCQVNQQCHKKNKALTRRHQCLCHTSFKKCYKKQQSIDNATPMFVNNVTKKQRWEIDTSQ